MKFKQVLKRVLKEKRIPITGATRTGKKYNLYRGITYLVLGENEPPDVHGIPAKMESYGRGWSSKSGIEVDGGPQGSRQGHPNWAENGFYWAVDKDARWKGQDGLVRKGVMYIRGRAGTSTDWLEKNIMAILDLIFKRLPR